MAVLIFRIIRNTVKKLVLTSMQLILTNLFITVYTFALVVTYLFAILFFSKKQL